MSRFEKLVQELMRKGKSRKAAEAIAATIGREKYGSEAFAAMAKAGRKKGK